MRRFPLLQVVLVTALTGLTATAFTTSFRASDLAVPVGGAVLLAAVLVAAAGLLGPRAAAPVRLLVVVAGAAAFGLAVCGTGGRGPVDALHAGLVDGWAEILSSRVPVAPSASRLMVPVAASWLASGVGVAGVLATRLRLATLLPAVLLWTTAALLGSGADTALVPIVVFVLVAAVFLAVRARWLVAGDAGSEVPVVVSGAGRSWVAVALASGAVVGLVALTGGVVAPVRDRAYTARESYEIPDDRREEINPLTVLASKDGDDDVAFHATLDRVPTVLGHLRFRGLVLDSFDEGIWRSPRGSEVTGSGLPDDPAARATAKAVHQRIEPGPELGGILPTVGRAGSFDAPDGLTVRVEPVAGVLSFDRREGGESGPIDVTSSSGDVDVTTLGGLGLAVSDEARAATGSPGLPAEIDELLERVAGGAATPFDQVARLLAYFRATDGPLRESSKPFQLDEDRPVGFTLAEIGRFVSEDGHVGARMQFVVAFATMARAQGLPTRIVTGWEPAELPEPGRRFAVTDSDRTAWVEIGFADVGWVPFDPAPDSADDVPTPDEQILEATVNETVAASVDDPPVVAPENPNGGRRGTSGSGEDTTIWPWVVAVALLVAAAAVVSPVVRKRRRARRRRRADDPVVSIVGAWDEAVDRFVEDGFEQRWVRPATDVAAASTDRYGDEVGAQFASLAGLVNYAIHGPDDQLDAVRAPAWELSDAIVLGIRRGRGRWQRIRRACDRSPFVGPGAEPAIETRAETGAGLGR